MSQHATCNHSKFGLECASYDALIARAAGRCEVCGVPAAATSRGKLLIDHDHARGQKAVRGLVCPACNYLLGTVDAGHDPALHREAVAAYLSRPWVPNPPPTAPAKRRPGARSHDWKIRQVRIPDAMWAALGCLAKEEASDRSSIIRELVTETLLEARRGRTGDTPTPDDHG